MIFLLFWLTPLHAQDGYEKQRQDMVSEQIRSRGITDPAILEAMARVKRHHFVPENFREQAYLDSPLPIGYGQTISQPYTVAFMTEVIEPKPGYRVLEIGTGSGYQAAVLAEIVEQVFTIETVPELGQAATQRLEQLDYENIEVRIGDGYYGWPEKAPFDAIVVTAAARSIPPPLLQQLKEGGKMVIPIGSPSQIQDLILVEKKKGEARTKRLFPVRFVPFTRK